MSWPTLFRSPTHQNAGSHGESLAERWRARLDFDLLEDRDVPAATGTGPYNVAAALAAPSSPAPAFVRFPPGILNGFAIPLPSQLTPAILPAFPIPYRATLALPTQVNFMPAVAPIWINQYGAGPSTPDRVPLELREVPSQMTAVAGEPIDFTVLADHGAERADNPQFSLEPVDGASFPEGASIDPDTGEFTWSPTPGFYAFRICVREGDSVASEIVYLRVE